MTNDFKGARLFLNIPVEVAHDPRIKSDKSILLFGEIYSMLNVTGSFYMSNKEIGKRIRAKARKVNDCLKELEDLGYIKRKIIYKPGTKQVDKRLITSDWRPGAAEYNTPPAAECDTPLHHSAIPPRTTLQDPPAPQCDIKEHINRTSNRTFKENTQAEPGPSLSQQRREVIDYLNKKTGKSFKPSAASNKKYIDPRLKEGFTVDDMKMIIDCKYSEWHGKTFGRGSNAKPADTYLRPETLFKVSKFESYLDEAKEAQKKKPKDDDDFDFFGNKNKQEDDEFSFF